MAAVVFSVAARVETRARGGVSAGLTRAAALASGRAFSLLEMLAVVFIIIILLGVVSLGFANAQPSVQIKKDAGTMIAFLRNAWDRGKASGSALILSPDFQTGKFSYSDPRTGRHDRATFSSDAAVLAVVLNDRVYSARSSSLTLDQREDAPLEDDGYAEDEQNGSAYSAGPDALHLSEGRGLIRIAVLFAIPDEDELAENDNNLAMVGTFTHITMATLNLINGRGRIDYLEPEDLENLLWQSEEQDMEREADAQTGVYPN